MHRAPSVKSIGLNSGDTNCVGLSSGIAKRGLFLGAHAGVYETGHSSEYHAQFETLAKETTPGACG